MGELHLEVIVDRLLREFNVDANVGRPQVAYRETIREPGREDRRATSSARRAARASTATSSSTLEPAPEEGFDFVNKIKGGAIPSEFIPAVEQGIEEALGSGVKAGYPMVDVRVELVDGKYHDVDSSEMAFKIAGSMAIQEAARRAKPVLLEPVMSVEVVTPEEFLGDVIGDLSRRRGKVAGPGAARKRARRPRLRAARRDVRLRDRRAVVDPGPRDLHDAVRALRRGPARASPSRSSSRPTPASPSGREPRRRQTNFVILPGLPGDRPRLTQNGTRS